MKIVFSLYQMVFPNGKRYIGISSDVPRRIRAHAGDARRGSDLPVHRAIRKYEMENVVVDVLVRGPKDYIATLEVEAIKSYRTRDGSNGYNVAHGGQISPMLALIGLKHSKETRAKMSAARKGRRWEKSARAKIKESNLRTMGTPEYKAKRSAASLKMQCQRMTDKKSASVRAAFARPDVQKRHRAGVINRYMRRQIVVRQFAFEQGA